MLELELLSLEGDLLEALHSALEKNNNSHLLETPLQAQKE
jgi:hypothetical protein